MTMSWIFYPNSVCDEQFTLPSTHGTWYIPHRDTINRPAAVSLMLRAQRAAACGGKLYFFLARFTLSL